MSLSTQLSSMLARDERGETVPMPKVCIYCNQAFYPVTGKHVRKPFILVNVSHGCCKVCYPTQLTKALETARRMKRS